MELLHELPGQVPDVDLVFQTTDTPLVPKGPDPAKAPPVFTYNSRASHADIPWPDFSYWGHEIGILNDDKASQPPTCRCAVRGAPACL